MNNKQGRSLMCCFHASMCRGYCVFFLVSTYRGWLGLGRSCSHLVSFEAKELTNTVICWGICIQHEPFVGKLMQQAGFDMYTCIIRHAAIHDLKMQQVAVSYLWYCDHYLWRWQQSGGEDRKRGVEVREEFVGVYDDKWGLPLTTRYCPCEQCITGK